jgi:two-component system NtrC family sensor kinase
MNATEAIRENGEIIIQTENENKESITFEICDNGIGIPEDDQKHIFEPFFSTKQESSGIGLGLPIVHGIIQSHEGAIRVRSAPGEGTSVIITLKLSRD